MAGRGQAPDAVWPSRAHACTPPRDPTREKRTPSPPSAPLSLAPILPRSLTLSRADAMVESGQSSLLPSPLLCPSSTTTSHSSMLLPPSHAGHRCEPAEPSPRAPRAGSARPQTAVVEQLWAIASQGQGLARSQQATAKPLVPPTSRSSSSPTFSAPSHARYAERLKKDLLVDRNSLLCSLCKSDRDKGFTYRGLFN
jgi:hypothetical protein